MNLTSLDAAIIFKTKKLVLRILLELILRFFLHSNGVEKVAASPYILNYYSCYRFRAFGRLKVLHSSLMQPLNIVPL